MISHIHTVFINLRGDFFTLQNRYLSRKSFPNSFLDSSPTSSWSRLRPYFRHFLEANWHKPWVTSVTRALCWAHMWKKRSSGACWQSGLVAQPMFNRSWRQTCGDCSRSAGKVWCPQLCFLEFRFECPLHGVLVDLVDGWLVHFWEWPFTCLTSTVWLHTVANI